MQYVEEPLRIYHESQSSQLCARHCLNNLLQGPYFNEFDLSKIALDLDKEEQQLLAQDGDSGLVEWLKHNKQSQNVSDDGNFSIQVLRRALDNLGLSISYWGNEHTASAQSHPENEQGFICNLQAHWFAVRRIGGVWYNLNSLSGLPETTAKPTTISNFYLSAYLSTLANDGYSINVVRSAESQWPHLHAFDAQQRLPKYAAWYLATEVKSRQETYPKELLAQVNQSRNGQNVTSLGWGRNNANAMTADEQLEYAMQQSLGGGGLNTNMNMNSMAQDPELAHALALSMKAHTNNNTNTNTNSVSVMEVDGVDDEEALLQQALAMSMQKSEETENTGDHSNNQNNTEAKEEKSEESVIGDEPDAEEKDCCLIQLRFPNHKAVKRRFRRSDLLEDVARFVKSVDASLKNVVFVSPPNASYHKLDISLDTVCTELKSQMLSFRVKENQNPKANADVEAESNAKVEEE